MKGLEKLLSNTLLPIASKLEKNKQLAAIRRAMMILVPVTLVGAIPILFLQLPGIPGMPAPLVNLFKYISKITNPLNLATYGTMGLIVAAFIGYYYSKERDVWDIGAILTSIMSFVCVATLYSPEGAVDLTYYGGSGIFTAIVISLFSVEILYIFRHKLKFTINLGEGVPTPILKSFENLWPILFSVLIVVIVKFVLESLIGTDFVKIIDLFFAPLSGLVSTLPGILLIMLLQQLLWWFGIHGYSIMSPLWMTVAFANVDANTAIMQAGGAMSEMYILTPGFMWNIAGLTGTGITGALVFLLISSKVKRYKALGKISLIPTFFGINEPIVFGLPMMLNPIMFIPFVFSAPIAVAIGWMSIKLGFLNTFTIVPPYIPYPLAGIVGTLDWRYLIVSLIIIVVIGLLYLPFFKIMEKKVLEEESKTKENQDSLDSLDFDF